MQTTADISWQDVFRRAMAPQLTDAGLLALARALRDDDPALIQGHTALPLQDLDRPYDEDAECEGACPLAYALWRGESLATVGDVEARFADLAVRSLDALPSDPEQAPPPLCVFARFVDHTPRAEMRRLLLAEVEQELRRRRVSTAS